MFCKKCNTKLPDGVYVCPNCGYDNSNDIVIDNNKSKKFILYYILAFLIPPLGYILAFIFKLKKNITKFQNFMKCAIIGTIAYAFFFAFMLNGWKLKINYE